MNRTDRLYALVEELRAAAPRPRSARWLAERFEVSTRTVERDLSALQQSGVPIYAEPGRTGGYTLDRQQTLPPLTMTAAEATALAVGLHALDGTPFAEAARTALHKVLAVMPERERAAADAFAARVGLIAPEESRASVPRALQEALSERRVLRLEYADKGGQLTGRTVEPLGFLGGNTGEHWYLIAWCRLREAVRGFRTDRIRAVHPLDETAPPRDFDRSLFERELGALGHGMTALPSLGGRR
ncbi:YafY family protein [Streptomyces sp. MST-110588]|uniref:helix-turn-helix transcriptional regulator n=1 Tax=Streptomyces sp. MST-110588 TaxID=2833628 RepID=UPI0020470360|nr:YafY family protein [Streptomyces sp. MST-110588]UNO40654.1 YafY family transcriptional regulator [Streptomyces sp. MST-110588]